VARRLGPSHRDDGGADFDSYRRLRDAFGLVVNLERDLLQLVGVLAAVVGAEQQLEAVGHGDADVGLCPAPIAPISGVQCGAFDD
jgi:hypothetical protein